jgi:hypothetical protein
MNALPETENTPFVRIDYSDREAWERVRATIVRPNENEFVACVDVIDDPAYDGLSPGQLLDLLPRQHHSIVIVADKRTLAEPDIPLLVIDLEDDPGRELRVIAEEAWSIENNLSIGNMYFEEFAEAAGDDGVFRGFGRVGG